MNLRNGSRLAGAVALYALASFVHFAHNAEFLGEYPNLPGSMTRMGVYAAWLALAAIGLCGWALYHSGWRRCGLTLLGVYAALGLAGLLHYSLAPMSAHDSMMNFTIGFEALAAVSLLRAISTEVRSHRMEPI